MPSRGLQTYDVHTWNTFVSSGVNVTPATRKLIETIMPYYPSACRCITGYQDEEAQFWKVDYHWDLIDHLLDKALALKLAAPFPTKLQVLKLKLQANPPVPQHGYMNSSTEGSPKTPLPTTRSSRDGRCWRPPKLTSPASSVTQT